VEIREEASSPKAKEILRQIKIIEKPLTQINNDKTHNNGKYSHLFHNATLCNLMSDILSKKTSVTMLLLLNDRQRNPHFALTKSS
jgi:hypothetical protein